MAHIEDVDDDGLTDLVVQVDTEAVGLWTSGTVILTATTYDGQNIEEECEIPDMTITTDLEFILKMGL